MKSLRIWILVLLAVLLPIRGAVAAVMGVAPAMAMHVGAAHDMASTEQDDMAMSMAVASDEPCDGDHEVSLAVSHPPSHHEVGGPSTNCGMCCDLCSLTPMLGLSAPMSKPDLAVAAAWIEPQAADPTFQVGGPERPPRSI